MDYKKKFLKYKLKVQKLNSIKQEGGVDIESIIKIHAEKKGHKLEDYNPPKGICQMVNDFPENKRKEYCKNHKEQCIYDDSNKLCKQNPDWEPSYVKKKK